MSQAKGGFYSSLDAGSEGEEGKFYVLKQDEIQNMLGDEYGFFKAGRDLLMKSQLWATW